MCAGAAPLKLACGLLLNTPRLPGAHTTQALCLLHTKARALLAKPQYLQLVTARACEAPACLPAALNTLLALLQVRAVVLG